MHPAALCFPAALRGDIASLLPSPVVPGISVGWVQQTQKGKIFWNRVGIPEVSPSSVYDLLQSARPIDVPTMPLGV